MLVDCASIVSKNIKKTFFTEAPEEGTPRWRSVSSHTRCCKTGSYSRAAEATRELDRAHSSSQRTDDSRLYTVSIRQIRTVQEYAYRP
jgi:hypothetical protein